MAELIAVYHRHAESYYVKNGEPTSELPLIKDSLKLHREHYGLTLAAEFFPSKLKSLRSVPLASVSWVRRPKRS